MASFESSIEGVSDGKDGKGPEGSAASSSLASLASLSLEAAGTSTSAAAPTAADVADAAPSSSATQQETTTTATTTTAVGPDNTPATLQTTKTMVPLTAVQEAALGSFKQQARPSDLEAAKYTVETTDQVCCRFLRARGFDVAKALVLLGECNTKLTEMRAAYWASIDPNEALQCDLDVLKVG